MHIQKIIEHFEELEDAIKIGVEKRPVTIGMHTSACSTELLELYLHKLGKIPIGKIIKHEWFKPPRPGQKVKPLAERMLPMVFPEKERMFRILYIIEDNRSKLVYGKPERATAQLVYGEFAKLKELLLRMLEKEGVKIEA